MEKSGIPLSLLFKPKFEILAGCTLGSECPICNNTGVGCNAKNVIYSMQCLDCTNDSGVELSAVDVDVEVSNKLGAFGAMDLVK